VKRSLRVSCMVPSPSKNHIDHPSLEFTEYTTDEDIRRVLKESGGLTEESLFPLVSYVVVRYAWKFPLDNADNDGMSGNHENTEDHQRMSGVSEKENEAEHEHPLNPSHGSCDDLMLELDLD